MSTDGPWSAVALLEEKMEWMSCNPSAGDALAAATTQVATDILVVTDAGDPGPWDVEEKIPKWLHTVGNLKSQWRALRWLPAAGALLEGDPSLPSLPSKSGM